MSRLRCPSLGLKRTIGRESVGATFQVGGKFGAGRSGGIPNAILISLTSEERRARPHITEAAPNQRQSVGCIPAPVDIKTEHGRWSFLFSCLVPKPQWKLTLRPHCD